jgi:hypothetical protein
MRKFRLVSTSAFLVGTELARAHIGSNPPGAAFQGQGNPGRMGFSVFREPSRT